MVVRIYEAVDVTARSQKIKSIKVPKIPQGAGFGDGNDEVVVLMRGDSLTSWQVAGWTILACLCSTGIVSMSQWQ